MNEEPDSARTTVRSSPVFDTCRRVLAAAITGGTAAANHNFLAGRILRDYRLPLRGIHGPAHWLRVMEYGRRLAEKTGADAKVVGLFGLLHDARRHADRHDPDHGPRGAAFARQLAEEGILVVSGPELDALCRACAGHTAGLAPSDVTVATCWDADRLDLHRFGWTIDPLQLNTRAAVEFVSAADPPFLESFFSR
jgi:uncharacterized protein